MKGLFKAYTLDEPKMWVTGYYSKYNSYIRGDFIDTKDRTYRVHQQSVCMHWLDGIYDGDIFVIDEYPFYDEGQLNYVGIIEYVPDDGYAGWYYGLQAVSDRVRGVAEAGSCADLEGKSIQVIGTRYRDGEMLNQRCCEFWQERINHLKRKNGRG